MADEHKGSDVDRGRAWIILVAAYLGNILFTAVYYSSGVIYVELLRHFNDDVIKTSLIGSVNGGLFCIFGPVSGFAINRFNSRVTTMAGGILMAVACLSSAFAPSIEWMIVTYGLIGGLGSTFAGIPSAVVLGFSFQKYRYFVLTLGSAMIGVGMLISSPMMLSILDSYGLRGGFIILGGISLQLCVLGALFKPSSIEIQLKNERHVSSQTAKDSVRNKSQSKSAIRKCLVSVFSSLDNVFHIKILKVVAYDLFLVSTMSWNLMTAVCQMHLPNYMTVKGEHPSHIALIMTLFGISNTLGRLFGTCIVTQKKKVDLFFWHTAMLLVSGTASCTFPWFKALPSSEMAFSVINGFCTGGANSLLMPITLRILGVEHLSSGYGMAFLFCGVGFLIGPPIASALYRSSGDYNSSFIFAGCISIIGGLSALSALLNLRRSVEKSTHAHREEEIYGGDGGQTVSLKDSTV